MLARVTVEPATISMLRASAMLVPICLSTVAIAASANRPVPCETLDTTQLSDTHTDACAAVGAVRTCIDRLPTTLRPEPTTVTEHDPVTAVFSGKVELEVGPSNENPDRAVDLPTSTVTDTVIPDIVPAGTLALRADEESQNVTVNAVLPLRTADVARATAPPIAPSTVTVVDPVTAALRAVVESPRL